MMAKEEDRLMFSVLIRRLESLKAVTIILSKNFKEVNLMKTQNCVDLKCAAELSSNNSFLMFALALINDFKLFLD